MLGLVGTGSGVGRDWRLSGTSVGGVVPVLVGCVGGMVSADVGGSESSSCLEGCV